MEFKKNHFNKFNNQNVSLLLDIVMPLDDESPLKDMIYFNFPKLS